MQPRHIQIRSSRGYATLITVITILAIVFNVFVYNYEHLYAGSIVRYEEHHDNPELGEIANRDSIELPHSRKLGHLTCEKYGKANQSVVDDLVYWYDIPSDQNYLNPYQDLTIRTRAEKYLLFEQDSAGFNNRRMSIETILIMGISMGRTIVLPPTQPIYMFKDRGGKHRHQFSFEDFFHLKEAHLEHLGVNIITMEEFLQRVLLQEEGLLVKDNGSGLPTFPPNNQTDWNNVRGQKLKELHDWFGKSTYSVTGWESNSCIAVWPKDTIMDVPAMDRIEDMMTTTPDKTHPKGRFKLPVPVPVNASISDRFEEQRATRKNLCLYNTTMQEQQIVYFNHAYDQSGNRFLSPFYTFHFYEDWYQALWTRRFVRDHLRYHDELMCAAARVLNAVRARVRKRGLSETPDGSFHTMHVRRGDFAHVYKSVVISAEQIYDRVKDIIEPNSTLFIATDHKNRTYFEPLTRHYDVCFLDDFAEEIKDVSSNLFGIIDQIIVSKGEVFFGTHFSTLSAYVNRLRGYYSTKYKMPGYELGKLRSFYFSPPHKYRIMTRYHAPLGPLWAYEFPMAWRDIDHGIPELQ